MKKRLALAAAIALAATGSAYAQGTQSPSWVERSNEDAKVLLDVIAQFNPENATQIGLTGYDEKVSDLKPDTDARQRKALLEAKRKLENKLAAEKDPNVRQDLQIMIKSAGLSVEGIDLNDKYMLPYQDMGQLIFNGEFALLRDEVDAKRRPNALKRLECYVGKAPGCTPLTKQAAQLHDQLAALCGQFPSQAPPLNLDLNTLQLPQNIPVSLPSTIVGQRPDILQAQENLHAASADIGIAIADRLPNIELTANAGSTALHIAQLSAPGAAFWNIGAALTQPIFEGGKLLHQERGARAAFDQASQQYRSTVLTAFQNVADSLVALEQDADALKSASAADQAARRTLELTQYQVKHGYTAYLSLLTAQGVYQQAHIALLQAQASRFADTAALFQALGGGWWHRTDLTENDHAK